MNQKYLRNLAIAFVGIILMTGAALAQEKSMTCNDGSNDGRENGFCEIKEITVPAGGGLIKVDGRRNGGISVKGWAHNEILVRARIQTHGNSEQEAKGLVNQVRIETGGANIYADGPESQNNNWWSVSFEVFVPSQSNLSLKTYNGGISINDVRGSIDFEANNGGIALNNLNGKVQGKTRNGGVSVKLAGSRWEGEGMDVQTTNGGINLSVPQNYSAHLETGTVNGGMRMGIPALAQNKIEKEFSTDLGGGGATIRLKTTNGGVSVKNN